MDATSNERYAEVNSRMNVVNGVGAGLITVLIMASDWREPRKLVEIALIQGAVIAFNTRVVNNVLLRKWGTGRAEILRIAVNVLTTTYVNHIAGWPIPAVLPAPPSRMCSLAMRLRHPTRPSLRGRRPMHLTPDVRSSRNR